MFTVGTLGSYITQGVYTFAGPFHPFGGAVDIVVVQQKDGTFKSSPWYVKFGKFQGVLQRREKLVDVTVNDVPANFHMYLDHKGEAFFEREVQHDEETILSLPAAGSSGDEEADFGRTKRLTYSKDSTEEGLEMQVVPNRDPGTKAVGILNECNSLKPGMPEDGNTQHVDNASTAWIPHTLVNRPNSEAVIELPETNCSVIEEQNETVNSSKRKLKNEDRKSERSERRPIFGVGFGRKSQQASPDASFAHKGRQSSVKELKLSPSLERAEMVADLLDRNWGTACKEILLTPTNRWQSNATGVGTDRSLAVETGNLMRGSVGSVGVVDQDSLGQSEFSRSETFAEDKRRSIMDESKVMESRAVMQGSEGSAVVMNEASSEHVECGDISRAETHTEVIEQSTMENSTTDDLHVDVLRLETVTKSREFTSETASAEGRFLDQAAEEQLLINVSLENSRDVPSSNDSFYEPIYGGVEHRRSNAAYTDSKKVALLGTFNEDMDQNTECVPSPEVVLVSGDGHIIVAPVDFEHDNLQSNEFGQHADRSKEFPNSTSCGHDVQVVGSFLDDSESLESGRRKGLTVKTLEVGVDSGLNQFSERSGAPVRIPEVFTDPLDGEVDAGRASELSSKCTIITSTEMTPDYVSEVEFKASEDNPGESCQNLSLVMTLLTAVDRSREEDANCGSEYPVVTQFTIGQDGMDLQSESGMNSDQLGTAAGCSPDNVIWDARKLATSGEQRFPLHMDAANMIGTGTDLSIPSIESSPGVLESSGQQVIKNCSSFKEGDTTIGDKRFPLHMEPDGRIVTDTDLCMPNIESGPRVLESSGRQVIEHFYSFKEGHNFNLKNEDSEDDAVKRCLYPEELPNHSGDDDSVAFLEAGDSFFELRHNGQDEDDIATAVSDLGDPAFDKRKTERKASSWKAVDFDLSKQPLEARSGTFARGGSKPIPVPQSTTKTKAELTSAASLPCRLYEIEREAHIHSRSVGSSRLYNINWLYMKEDGTDSFDRNMEESMVDLVDMQVMEAIIYGSGKDSDEIVNTADDGKSSNIDVDLSLCRHLLSDGMGAEAAAKAFASHRVSFEEFQHSGSAIFADEKLVVKVGERYFSWVEAAPYILDIGAAGSEAAYKMEGGIAVEMNGATKDVGGQGVAMTATTRWKLWPFSVRRSRRERGSVPASTVPKQALLTATNLAIASPFTEEILRKHGYRKGSTKFRVRTYVPTSQQLASLKLKEGSNKVTFAFSTPVLGRTQVDARIYLWNWNTRIVVSDVDGTITRSDVLGQVMPLVGRDWTQTGVTRLFSAIKDNGYEMLFLSARAITQAYLTRQFLLNLKQDGETLPDGPVFISPDGLLPSLYREVIRRAPHEFKISCLQGIRELFPSDVNPFYAGFGNRDTDEISYLKVGIPKGKIFIINPKGEVAVNHLVDSKSYSSLHTLVDDMFPPMSSGEQEDFNSWNFWKLPLPDVDDELTTISAKSTKRGVASKRAI